MELGQIMAVVVGLMLLIGGPLYLVSKAVERHSERKAEAWRVSPAGIQHHAEIAAMRVDSLGPLSLEEHQALLFNILWVSSHQGSIDWPHIVAQTSGARQMVRHHLEGLAAADAKPEATEIPIHGSNGPDGVRTDETKPTSPRH